MHPQAGSTDGRTRAIPTGIRCVAFDAVGTLIDPTPPATEVYFQVARQHGSQLPADEIARRFRIAFRETAWSVNPAVGSGFVTSEEIEYERWRRIVAQVIDDVADNRACFDELFLHFGRPAAWRMFDDVADTLSALTRRGLQIAIASNFDRRLHAVCDAYPPLTAISCRVISSEVGWRKPSREFYEALLRAVDCQPDELLMVGDDRENDVIGAAQAGIAGVLIDRRGRADNGAIASLKDLTVVDFRLQPAR